MKPSLADTVCTGDLVDLKDSEMYISNISNIIYEYIYLCGLLYLSSLFDRTGLVHGQNGKVRETGSHERHELPVASDTEVSRRTLQNLQDVF